MPSKMVTKPADQVTGGPSWKHPSNPWDKDAPDYTTDQHVFANLKRYLKDRKGLGDFFVECSVPLVSAKYIKWLHE